MAESALMSKPDKNLQSKEFLIPNKDGSLSKKIGLTRNRSSFFLINGGFTGSLTYESAYASDQETVPKRQLMNYGDRLEGCETPRLGGLSDDSRYYSGPETPYKDSLT